MKLFDTIKLKIDIPQENLRIGHLGTVVHLFERDPKLYEVEFADDQGKTITTITLNINEVELFCESEN